MKIGIVAHSAMGGSVFFAVSLARELAVRGHNVWLITPPRLPYIGIVRATDNLHHVEVPDPLVGADGIPEDASPFITRMLDLQREVQLDVINVHYVVPYLAYLLAARDQLDCPLVGTFHGTDLYPSDDMRPLQSRVLAMSRLADGLSVVCRVGLKEIGADRDFTPNFPLDVAPENPSPRQPHRLLHISNFRPVKNVPFLIRGFTAFAERHPECADATLELIGEGPEKKVVREMIREAGLTDRITLTPATTDRDALMDKVASAGAVVLTSHRECCPLVFPEAMTCRTLCIGARVGGIPDLLDHNRGLLYEPDQLNSLVAALARWASDPAAMRTTAEAGFEFVTNDLSAEAICRRYLALYERVSATRATTKAS